MTEAIYICGASRSAIGAFGGTLKNLWPADLSEPVAKAALARAGATPEMVDETIWGHSRQAGGGPNTARQVAFRAGVPVTSPAYTVNQACASGMLVVGNAARLIKLGEADVVLAGGVESMSNTPYYLLDARWGMRMGHKTVTDGMYRDGFMCPLTKQLMGATAEILAEKYDISRQEQDEHALSSQQRAGKARDEGWFADEIVPIEVKGRKGAVSTFDRDEHPRPTTTVEKLGRLRAVFKDNGTVHAGNASGVTDGAAAVVVASAKAVEKYALKPMAKMTAYTTAGVAPELMGIGPVPATRKLLEQTGLSLDDIDLIELNEAFAAQIIACHRELGFDWERTNVHGGSIALGHPIGATGTRIIVTLLHAMKRRGAQRGLATLCVSGGMGVSALFEAV